jgi:hypothetical protein
MKDLPSTRIYIYLTCPPLYCEGGFILTRFKPFTLVLGEAMSKFEKFFNSFTFQTIVHGLIFIMLSVNIFYILQIQSCQNFNLNLATSTAALSKELEQIDNQEAYQNSQLFQDKEIKQRNYKNKGEQVIDLSLIEKQPENPDFTYIPTQVTENSNFNKWTDVILNGKYINDLRC